MSRVSSGHHSIPFCSLACHSEPAKKLDSFASKFLRFTQDDTGKKLARLVGRGFDRLEGSIDGRFVRLEDKIAEFRQETAVRFNGTNKKIDG